ncbi:MAG: DUF2520 domain-containing protein [Candidatus Kapabacteria bacterium]|jgi:predicted short-subunit dehydrogenase-like oxidoreductase (DUF2520 family)|nr:DUF2520 domain-containing protein [Candidatus Kapabacteria bacterium]
MNDYYANRPIRVGIVGAGKLGLSLAKLFNASKQLVWVVERNDSRRRILKKNVQADVYASINHVRQSADFIFITVGDPIIRNICKELCRKLGVKLKGKHIIHCSGSKKVDLIESVRRVGAVPVAAHPYQSFYYPSERLFDGISWGVEVSGDPDPVIKFLRTTGGFPVLLSEETASNKALYHSSAVVSTNFISMVLKLATKIALKAGIKPEQFIPHIVRTSVYNHFKAYNRRDSMPLTGPFARGDVETIETHLEMLKDDPELERLYKVMADATLDLSDAAHYYDSMTFKAMKKLIEGEIKD